MRTAAGAAAVAFLGLSFFLPPPSPPPLACEVGLEGLVALAHDLELVRPDAELDLLVDADVSLGIVDEDGRPFEVVARRGGSELDEAHRLLG